MTFSSIHIRATGITNYINISAIIAAVDLSGLKLVVFENPAKPRELRIGLTTDDVSVAKLPPEGGEFCYFHTALSDKKLEYYLELMKSVQMIPHRIGLESLEQLDKVVTYFTDSWKRIDNDAAARAAHPDSAENVFFTADQVSFNPAFAALYVHSRVRDANQLKDEITKNSSFHTNGVAVYRITPTSDLHIHLDGSAKIWNGEGTEPKTFANVDCAIAYILAKHW